MGRLRCFDSDFLAYWRNAHDHDSIDDLPLGYDRDKTLPDTTPRLVGAGGPLRLDECRPGDTVYLYVSERHQCSWQWDSRQHIHERPWERHHYGGPQLHNSEFSGKLGAYDNINSQINPSIFATLFPGSGNVDGHLAQSMYGDPTPPP